MPGPEFNYNYAAKNAVRAEWMGVLGHSLESPRSAHGLYLPGPQNLELPGYMDLGIPAAYLIGCENDPVLQSRVAKSGGGIQFVCGSVKDGVDRAVALGWPCLDFAYIDLNGPYDAYLADLMSVFRLFPGVGLGVLGITSYSARDDDALESGMTNLSKFASVLSSAHYHEGVAHMVARWEELREFRGSDVAVELALSREIGLLWWLFYVCALVEPTESGPCGMDRTWEQRVDPHLEYIERQMRDTGRPGEYRLVLASQLGQVLAERRTVLAPRSLAMYMHYSKTGQQPMRTWILTVAREDIPMDQRSTALDLLADFWDLAAATPLVLVNNGGMRVEIGR